jgi:hypothetical protein
MRQVVAVTKISRFRRSQEEIELGLTREQAEARRAQQAPLYSKGPKAWPKPHTVVVKEDGAIISTPIVSSTLGRSIASPEKPAKRFRRTPAEIEAGLTIEQARAQRQGVMTATHGIPAGTGRIGSFVKPTVYVERPAAPLRGTADLITTIDPKLQARATVMTRMRRGNTKGVITKEMLDAAMEFTGKVTKCPPCTDSDGYNHLTGEQA